MSITLQSLFVLKSTPVLLGLYFLHHSSLCNVWKIRLHGYVTVFSTSNPIELQILSTDGPSHSSAYRLFLHVQFNISLREVRQSGTCLKFPTGKAETGRTQVPGWPTWANNEMLSQEVTKKKKVCMEKHSISHLTLPAEPSSRSWYHTAFPVRNKTGNVFQ